MENVFLKIQTEFSEMRNISGMYFCLQQASTLQKLAYFTQNKGHMLFTIFQSDPKQHLQTLQ